MRVMLLCLALAICATTASFASAEQLTITVRGGDFGDRSYTLGCDPAAGTVPKPSAACATLQAHPDALQPHPGQDHSCPPGTPTYEIAGTFAGTPVAASFSDCVSGQGDGLTVWAGIVHYAVPVLHGHPTLKVDRGIGPLRLGERVETVEHGTRGQLLGETRVAYQFGRGTLYAHYGSDRRIDRIQPSVKVDLGTANVQPLATLHLPARAGLPARHRSELDRRARDADGTEARVAGDRRLRRRAKDLRRAQPRSATASRIPLIGPPAQMLVTIDARADPGPSAIRLEIRAPRLAPRELTRPCPDFSPPS